MGEALRYWQFIRMNAAGDRQIEDTPAARGFLQQQFPAIEQTDIADAPVQRHLLAIMRSNGTDATVEAGGGDNLCGSTYRHLAEWCLRCFISHQTDWICRDLTTKFGQVGGFSWSDLYGLVMDDFHPHRPQVKPSTYQSVATRILQTLDLNQGQLSTWTKRLVMAELNPFLLDCGIYIASDWALLNGMPPERLQRLCQQTYKLPQDTHQMVQLLTVYHAVYRQDRRQQHGPRSRSKCLPPTAEQLNRMVEALAVQSVTYSPAQALKELKAIAQFIRQVRCPTTSSIDDPQCLELPDHSVAEENAETELLHRYRQDLLLCLEDALKTVVQRRYEITQQEQPKKAARFLPSLCLFHCDGESMGKIGKTMQLGTQPTVSRFLALDQLRADVRQTLLLKLRDRVKVLAATYVDQSRLEAIDQQLDLALLAQVDPIITEAEAEASTPNRPRKSLFSRLLCRYLKTQHTKLCPHSLPIPIA